jgi:hypothetical protein
MLFFMAEGRLGNQIFQYAFLKNILKKNELLVTSGFEELNEVFLLNDFININNKKIINRIILYKIIRLILLFLSYIRIISSISINREKVLEKYTRETVSYSKTDGLINAFIYVKLGFFQSEQFFCNKLVENFKIKDVYLKEAKLFLMQVPEDTHKVFIHIRRGDFKDYKVYGKSTLLPLEFFRKQIEWFKINKEKPFFIFFSDDTEFVENEFQNIENKIISSNNHFGTDLSIMSECQSAILSPSSFGWWGSYLMKDRDTVFVPRFWLGFNSNENYTAESITKYMIAVDVNKMEYK